jgi:hypothetical protein
MVDPVTNAGKPFGHTLLRESHWELGKVHADSMEFMRAAGLARLAGLATAITQPISNAVLAFQIV